MGDRNQKTILIVDDDPDFLDFVTIVLESAGHTVHTAPNAGVGLDMMQASNPDLVIVDVMISYELNGWLVNREMSADPELAQIPILMVSAIVNERDEKVFPQNGSVRIDAFMSKPLEPSDLLRRIEELIGPS